MVRQEPGPKAPPPPPCSSGPTRGSSVRYLGLAVSRRAFTAPRHPTTPAFGLGGTADLPFYLGNTALAPQTAEPPSDH